MSGPRVLVLAEQLRRRAPGGIGTYVRGLLQGLGSVPEAERPQTVLAASRTPGAPGASEPLSDLGAPLWRSRLPGRLLTRGWDRGLVRAPSGFDVVQATSLATPGPSGVPLAVTVHDLLWRQVPATFPARGRTWHEAALHRAVRRASRFVVPSAVVARDLGDAGVAPDRIEVIPMGCDHLPSPDLAAARDVLVRLGVEGPFLLSVGTVEPRKNQLRLVEAYGTIRGRLPEPWPLVLVGPSGWGGPLEPGPGVVPAGTVSPPVLAGLYSAACLFAYVPLLEGFGIPPVEAMAHGTPVVASPVPSTGRAAYEVDPEDIDSIANGLVEVATDEGVRAGLVASGLRRAAELTWANSARAHVELWSSLRGSGAPGRRAARTGRGTGRRGIGGG